MTNNPASKPDGWIHKLALRQGIGEVCPLLNGEQIAESIKENYIPVNILPHGMYCSLLEWIGDVEEYLRTDLAHYSEETQSWVTEDIKKLLDRLNKLGIL